MQVEYKKNAKLTLTMQAAGFLNENRRFAEERKLLMGTRRATGTLDRRCIV